MLEEHNLPPTAYK